jgi:hypothetical protein
MTEKNEGQDLAADKLRPIGEIVEVIDEGDFVEIVEIEIFAKDNRKPPPGRKYKFRIDREHFTVDHRIITGEKLFELAKKSPAEYRMHQKRHGGHMREVKVDDKIDLGEPGIERFATMKVTEGDGEQALATQTLLAESKPRRQFQLPSEDEGYLNSLGLSWEAIKNEHGRWVLLHKHPLPPGYSQQVATMAIRIEGGYPPGRLDMAFFLPHLTRADGKPIHKISSVQIDGCDYQQWSRHYEWSDDVDTLATHHLHVTNWLDAEPKR